MDELLYSYWWKTAVRTQTLHCLQHQRFMKLCRTRKIQTSHILLELSEIGTLSSPRAKAPKSVEGRWLPQTSVQRSFKSQPNLHFLTFYFSEESNWFPQILPNWARGIGFSLFRGLIYQRRRRRGESKRLPPEVFIMHEKLYTRVLRYKLTADLKHLLSTVLAGMSISNYNKDDLTFSMIKTPVSYSQFCQRLTISAQFFL